MTGRVLKQMKKERFWLQTEAPPSFCSFKPINIDLIKKIMYQQKKPFPIKPKWENLDSILTESIKPQTKIDTLPRKPPSKRMPIKRKTDLRLLSKPKISEFLKKYAKNLESRKKGAQEKRETEKRAQIKGAHSFCKRGKRGPFCAIMKETFLIKINLYLVLCNKHLTL